jgi:hypothetical protein
MTVNFNIFNNIPVRKFKFDEFLITIFFGLMNYDFYIFLVFDRF